MSSAAAGRTPRRPTGTSRPGCPRCWRRYGEVSSARRFTRADATGGPPTRVPVGSGAHGDPTGREGRAGHRARREGIGKAIAAELRGVRRQGDAVVAQAGRARGGGRRDAGGDGRRSSPPTPATSRPADACVRRHHRALRRPRHPRQQRRHQPVLRPDARHRPGPLRQDVRGQHPRPGVLVPVGVGAGVQGPARRHRQHRVGRRPAGRGRPRRLQRHQGGADPPHPPAGRRARPRPGSSASRPAW